MKASDLEKFHQILRQTEFFYDFLGSESLVTPGMRFVRKSWKSRNGLS